MKLSANRETILQPLQAVIGVVERRQTMPILANVLLSARNGRLSVTATDLEVELVAALKYPCRAPAISPYRVANSSIFVGRCRKAHNVTFVR